MILAFTGFTTHLFIVYLLPLCILHSGSIFNGAYMTTEREQTYSLLKSVTVDCKDDGKTFQVTDRIKVICDYLKTTSFQLLAQEDLFLLFGKKTPAKGEPVVLLSSHIDCVYQRCFCTEGTDTYQGTFDNSFTNAALLYVMKHGSLPDNVLIAFTGDEEHDSAGAVAVNVYLTRQQHPIQFALVLDVTNAGWEKQHLFAIENDLGIDLLTAHRIIETVKPYEGKYTFLHRAEPDETWDYDEYDIPCMTLSAPVGGRMHGEEGVLVRKDTFSVYCDVLGLLAQVLTRQMVEQQAF